MRIVKYGAGVVGAWLCATGLGALAALGPARWVKGDWTAQTLLAGLAAGAAFGALVWLGLHSSHRRWVRVVVIVLALPFVAIAALPVGVAVWSTHPTHATDSGARPSDAVRVTIDADDGVLLAAWYVPTRNGAAVVLSHGSGSTKDDVVRHAEVLANAGYGVLAFDARGHGESTGQAMELGWWGERDIGAALNALAAMPGVDPGRIGLVGLSMGAEESIGAAGVDPRVAAVVAEGATARTAEDKDGWLPGGVPGLIQRRMDAERDLLLEWLTTAPKPDTLRSAALESGAPFLIITAGAVPDEAAAAAWIAGGNERVEVWTVTGAAHTRGLSTRPDEWDRRVIEFLDRVLAG